jgi:signal transduction histidine kinase/DNA-binding response OmpR family regulator
MSDSDKVNILIVDDLPEKHLVLSAILEELDQNIITARSGDEALRQVLDKEFAVILLDVNMPGMDGFETAAYIRRRKRSAHTPIIFITAFADELHTAQGYSLGAVDYILSPVVPDVLRTKVKVFVDLFRMTQQVRRQAEERVALIQEQAARAAAEENTRRSSFLAEAGAALAGSLDPQTTARNLARLAVPFLADLCSVTVVGAHGQPWHSEVAWVLPQGGAVDACTLVSSEAPRDELREALEESLASGRMQILEELDVPYPPPGCNGSLPPGTDNRAHAAVVLPLMARGHTLGALTLALGASGRRYRPADLVLAEDLAGRAAIALDNARLYQDIQEGDRRKNEFLAMLAHELRNPLAPIRNAVQVMRMISSGDLTVAQARDIIDRQVTHMARLIDDLLDMSRLSRGKILLRKEPLNLVQLVRGVTEDYRSILEDAGLTLHVHLPDEPIWTLGDPTRLSQVVGNVLHNAQKFTDRGGQVSVALEAEPDGKHCRIVVRDTGIGMDAEMLARVFDAFSQADRSLDRSRGGLGLGLALVKGLLDLHGGEVLAASEGVGQGTEITIRLPMEEQPVQVRRAEPASGGADSVLRVLVIEDNHDAAESMRVLLSLNGHEVKVAFSGPSAMEVGRDHLPEVVLCDIGLPGGMDGYAVARAFRSDPRLSGAFMIALTGYGQEEDQRRSREAGFDVHLTKPVDFTELQRLLATLPVPN